MVNVRLKARADGTPSNFESSAEADEVLALLRLPEDNRLWALLNLLHSGYSRADSTGILKISISTVNRHLRDLYARWQERAKDNYPRTNDRGLFFLNGVGIPAKPRFPLALVSPLQAAAETVHTAAVVLPNPPLLESAHQVVVDVVHVPAIVAIPNLDVLMRGHFDPRRPR